MDEFKEFLETSTIGGLNYISTTKRIARLFWITVVVRSFTISFVEIWNLFQDWEKNPIKTTTETWPISKLTLPNITVCPPRDSFLNLNYDISESKKIEIDSKTRKDLLEYAIKIVQDSFYAEIIRNLSLIDDPDRNSNWYKGYARIRYPLFLERRFQYTKNSGGGGGVTITVDNQLWYDIYSIATAGNISTKDFGQQYEEDKIERNIFVRINVYAPESVKGNGNVTFMSKIRKVTIQKDEEEPEMKVNEFLPISNDLYDWSENFTGLGFNDIQGSGTVYTISMNRKLSDEDIRNSNEINLPGFRFSWSYDKDVEPSARYSIDVTTRQFVRYLHKRSLDFCLLLEN